MIPDDDTLVVLSLMRKSGRPALETLDAQAARTSFDPMSERAEADRPEIAAVIDGTLPGPAGALRYRRYLPANSDRLPTLVYFHGGGFVLGNLDTHDSTCRRIARTGGCQVVAIDYRLAPEHRFPAAIEDAVAAFRHIAANASEFGTDANLLAIGGDSAGGNLAAVVCQAQKQAAEPMPSLQILIYPLLDQCIDAAPRDYLEDRYFISERLLRWFSDNYLLPGQDRRDPRVSPLLLDDLGGFPPAYILIAGLDPLRNDALAYADRLAAASIKVTSICYPGQMHGFFSMTRFLPSGLQANDEVAYALKSHFEHLVGERQTSDLKKQRG